MASTTAVGSTNNVEPLEETSWMTPPTSPRCSAFTGTTKRPLRSETTASCKYLDADCDFVMASSLSRMEFSAAWILRRISYSVSLAVSAISFSDKIESFIVFYSVGWGVMA